MLAEVEKDTSIVVIMNPSIQFKAIYYMNIPPTTTNPAPQVLVTFLTETTTFFSYSRNLSLT